MPIFLAKAPPSAAAMAGRALSDLGHERALAAVDSGGGPATKLHDPLGVFHIPMARLAQTTTAQDARQIGWRYFVENGDELRTVDVHGQGKDRHVTAVTTGGSVESLSAATTLAADRSTNDTLDYEARVLEFGRAGPGALWLHTHDGPDRFFSLDAEPREVSEKDVIANALKIAVSRRGDGGGGVEFAHDLAGDIGG